MLNTPKAKEIILGGLALAGVACLSSLAFSDKSRKEIGERDNWTCQNGGCRRSFKEGYMVHAAHYPTCHNKNRDDYNDPDSGRILCLRCHLLEHINIRKHNGAAIRLLAQTAWDNGFRTYQYGNAELDRDRSELIDIFVCRGINPADYIIME